MSYFPFTELSKIAERENIYLNSWHIDDETLQLSLLYSFKKNIPLEELQEIKLPYNLDFNEMIKKIKETKKEEKNNSDLLKELLNNPRVESISIKIDKAGNVETTNIEAKLKEMNK